MSFFVDKRPVAVSDEAGNTVWVLSKMGIGVRAAVAADFMAMGNRSLSAHQLCLMRHNIVRWEGPDFTMEDDKGQRIPVPCSHANIDRLDMEIPVVNVLFTAVIMKIYELNNPKEADVSAEEAAADPISAADDS